MDLKQCPCRLCEKYLNQVGFILFQYTVWIADADLLFFLFVSTNILLVDINQIYRVLSIWSSIITSCHFSNSFMHCYLPTWAKDIQFNLIQFNMIVVTQRDQQEEKFTVVLRDILLPSIFASPLVSYWYVLTYYLLKFLVTVLSLFTVNEFKVYGSCRRSC